MNYSNPSLQILLNRLEFVHRDGESFRAQCPVHQGKSKRSLKITLKEDGRVLLHCFSEQCPPHEILQVCGLQLPDIMPERIAHNASPEERQRWKQAAQHKDWLEAAQRLQSEARVIYIAAQDICNGNALNDADSARVGKAMERIENIGKMLNG